jgi:hypothetical protein
MDQQKAGEVDEKLGAAKGNLDKAIQDFKLVGAFESILQASHLQVRVRVRVRVRV